MRNDLFTQERFKTITSGPPVSYKERGRGGKKKRKQTGNFHLSCFGNKKITSSLSCYFRLEEKYFFLLFLLNENDAGSIKLRGLAL